MHTGFNFIEQFVPCECCGPKYTSCTVTTHKWTKKEVEHELLMLSMELAKSRWYNRGRITDRIKHWAEKLARYTEVESEFNL